MTKDWRQLISSLTALHELGHICCVIVVCKSFSQRYKNGTVFKFIENSTVSLHTSNQIKWKCLFHDLILYKYKYMVILQKLFFLSVFPKVENLCLSTGTCSWPFVINNFNPTINVRWYFRQLYLLTATLTLIWRVIFITEAANSDCQVSFILPGQLILLAFLVETFFF